MSAIFPESQFFTSWCSVMKVQKSTVVLLFSYTPVGCIDCLESPFNSQPITLSSSLFPSIFFILRYISSVYLNLYAKFYDDLRNVHFSSWQTNVLHLLLYVDSAICYTVLDNTYCRISTSGYRVQKCLGRSMQIYAEF